MIILTSLVNKIKANLKELVILALVCVLGVFGFKACRKVQQKQDKQATSTVLTPDQKEKIVVNPEKHTISITTKKANGQTQTTTTYLPDRPTQVIESNDGKLSIIDHKYGTEIRPFLGIGGSLDGSARVHAGTDLFYFHKLDLGLGLDLNAKVFSDVKSFNDTRVALNASYNVYSNTSIALSIDNRKFVGLFVKLRI